MGTVIVITEKENKGLYSSFSLEGESIKICPIKGAIDFITQNFSDLIILDAGFDVEKGFELLKEIKVLLPGTPVIFLTDIDAEDVVLKAFKTGARDFFKKPFHIAELRETVMGILSVKKGTKEKRQRFRQSASPHEKSLVKLTPNHPINVIRVIRYIEENLSGSINLEKLAHEATTSKYHFCRLFKKHMGLTPMKFVISLRIMKAKNLLKIPDSLISSVASDVGFNDLSSFIVQFKKFTGTTPSQYKESCKKKK